MTVAPLSPIAAKRPRRLTSVVVGLARARVPRRCKAIADTQLLSTPRKLGRTMTPPWFRRSHQRSRSIVRVSGGMMGVGWAAAVRAVAGAVWGEVLAVGVEEVELTGVAVGM